MISNDAAGPRYYWAFKINFCLHSPQMTAWDTTINVTTTKNIKASLYTILLNRIFKVLCLVFDTDVFGLYSQLDVIATIIVLVI